MSKASAGNFFEDLRVGQEFSHNPPRTLTEGDAALFLALTGARQVLHCADPVARQAGLPRAPLNDMLVFNVVFGQSVQEISLNAVATLGYANGRFGAFVYPGDTLTSRSTVIGLRETSNRKTGVVYVRTRAANQDGALVLEYVRWTMINKRDPETSAPSAVVPALPERVALADLVMPDGLDLSNFGDAAAGPLWNDYRAGERIDHLDGMTVEESEHMLATRLYQNLARIHFNRHAAHATRFGRRVVYGGHVMSLARALSWNGLASAVRIAAINGGRHTAPIFAGDTIYAWSEVVEAAALPGRRDVGALRLRTIAVKNRTAAEFPLKDGAGAYDPSVALDLDYTALVPRR